MHATNPRAETQSSANSSEPLLALVAPRNTHSTPNSFIELVRQRGMRKLLALWGTRGFLLLMLLGSLFITFMSLPYFDFETLPPFVIEKLPLRFETVWLAALRIHVTAAALSFPLCLAAMTRASQRRARLHRWLGRFTGGLVLFALVPSGAVLAFDAKGGPIVTIGFLLSALIVAGAMVSGVQSARRRDLLWHARAMRHVLGQMSVAVVSRAMIVGLDAASVDPELAYVVALWGPVLASVAVVEWLSRRPISKRKPVEHNERIARESSPLAVMLPVRALPGPVARDGG